MPATAKICGLTTAATLDTAIAGGASHVGFVFFPPSPRAIDFDGAAALAARVPDRVRRVGVFVNPCDALLERAIGAGRLDVVQLHDTASNRAAAIRAKQGCEVWGALAIRTRADLAEAQRFGGAADALLYDAKPPPGAAHPGGTGLRFDWTLLDGFRHPLPWILSGGLDAGDVADAIARTGATMVDVSTGVETAPGVKDERLIAAFLRAVANA